VRNALTAIAALASALIVGAALQKAFSLLSPALATRVVGVADVGTYVGYASVAVCFFICGFIAPRGIRSRFPLAWLLLPIAVVYAAAIIPHAKILECLPAGGPVLADTFAIHCAAGRVRMWILRAYLARAFDLVADKPMRLTVAPLTPVADRRRSGLHARGCSVAAAGAWLPSQRLTRTIATRMTRSQAE